MSSHSVDDLLLGKVAPKAPEPVKVEHTTENASPKEDKTVDVVDESADKESLTYTEKFRRDKEEYLSSENEDAQHAEPQDSLKVENKKQSADDSDKFDDKNTDDYGNELPKERVFTEAEVQALIKDRLSRGKYSEQPVQPTPQEVKAATEDFQADPNSEESWEKQLEAFVDSRLEAKEKKVAERQWQERERKVQAEFEAKFTMGVQRYKDFEKVVAGKPITNEMMMAVRTMPDPAAFIYAAAKQQPKELERIAAIPDAYQQATEMGRLEERMKKARTVSHAPKPLARTKGDAATGKDASGARRSVDSLIQEDAKRKLSRR